MKPSFMESQFYKSLIDNLYDGVYFVDRDRLITYWNKGAERITGYCAGDVVGRHCHANILDHVTDAGEHLCTESCPLMATIRDGTPRETEVHLRHVEGYRIPVLVRTTPIYDEQGKIVGAVEVFSNNQTLMKIRRRVDQLEQDVHRDALTGLGNRALLEMKLASALREYQEYGVPFGVLFMDIDRFKSINDTYGHQAGDAVLKNLSKNLSRHLRNTDVCGRWGGEEFVAILHNVDESNILKIAGKLLAMIANSTTTIEDIKLSATVSIGATVIRETDTRESIIQRADALMYQSKQAGRNRVTGDGTGIDPT